MRQIKFDLIQRTHVYGCVPAELGDCDPAEHALDMVSEFRFMPEQTEAMELAIFNTWKECR